MNGWTNYETWNVALWVGKEEGSYSYWRERTQAAFDASDGDKESAACDLASELKDWVDENCPITEASMYCDLLGAALSKVNYHEIAEDWLEYVEQPEPEEEEDDEDSDEDAE